MASGTLSPRRTRTFRGDDHDVSRRLARAVAIRDGLVQLHGEAVVLREAIRDAPERHLETALLHPDLLMNAHGARACFVRHPRAGRQNDLDDVNGRGEVGRRNIASDIAGLRVAPRGSIIAPGHRVGRRSEEHTSELQSLAYLVCRLLLEKKKNTKATNEHMHV